MLHGGKVTQDDAKMVRLRLREAMGRVSEREQELGREGFVALPESVQNRLAVLQAQATPKGRGAEAILAAEHILERYEQQLRGALDLVRQVAGEAGRAGARRRHRRLVGWAIIGAVIIGAVVASVLYRGAVAEAAAACARSAVCREDGRCGAGLKWAPPPVEIACRAEADGACRDSSGCTEHGRCSARKGACLAAVDADCASTKACRVDGWCSARQGKCVAATVKDCRPTKACTARGACTPVDEVCKPGSDADCRQSDICRTAGACQEVDNRCVELPDGFAK